MAVSTLSLKLCHELQRLAVLCNLSASALHAPRWTTPKKDRGYTAADGWFRRDYHFVPSVPFRIRLDERSRDLPTSLLVNMAMLHPDDEAFAKQQVLSDESISSLFKERLGLLPTRISASESQGAFHKVYFVSLPITDGNPWSGRDVVLRVARCAVRSSTKIIRPLRECNVGQR